MTSNEPAPDQSSGLPSYGSTPAGDGGATSPPPPGAPGGYGSTPTGNNGKALASLILGIVGVVGAIVLFCLYIVGFVFGALAIVFGQIAKGEIKRTGQGGAGQAKAGVILGIVAIVLNIIWIVIVIIVIATGNFDIDSYNNM